MSKPSRHSSRSRPLSSSIPTAGESDERSVIVYARRSDLIDRLRGGAHCPDGRTSPCISHGGARLYFRREKAHVEISTGARHLFAFVRRPGTWLFLRWAS